MMGEVLIELDDLPNGWLQTKINGIADVLMGQSPPSDTYNEQGIGLPFFQGKAEFTDLHPVVKKWCKASNKIAEPNDILMSVRAPVGATNIANVICCIGRGLSSIRYSQCNKFLFYFFRFIEKKLDEKGTGTTFRAISGDIIKNTKIYLPPLPEQHRIVAKIEELFSSLDKGIENLKTAQEQLKTYRQAVLKWAFEGRFTHKDVKEGELPEEWKWVKLKDITICISDGDHLPPPKSSSGVPFITISNIHRNLIDFSSTMYVKEDYYRSLKENRKPLNGDILYTVTGSYGIPVLINFDKIFCFQRHIGLVRPQKTINKKWLFYLLQSPQAFLQAKKTATGTAQKTVALSVLREFLIPFCESKEQELLVQEIESRLSVCDKLEESIQVSLQQAEALRQSILKKAFEGELVPQDPKDEPASVLLERIRAERSKNSPTRKVGRTRNGK